MADAQPRSTGVAATRLQEARELAAAGRTEAAEQAVQKILAAEPNRYDALVMLGELLEARGDLTGATIAYERAVRARSGSAVAHDKLGFVLGRQNRIPEALAEFARAIKLDPTLFDAQYHLGATRWWTRDLEGRVGPLRAAVRLRPDHAEARYYLGTTLRQLGRIPEAVAQLREAVRLSPSLAPGVSATGSGAPGSR